jgi:hypothetical protein
VAAASDVSLSAGQRAKCRFRFLFKPEYLPVGTSIVLREGRTRGVGRVVECFPVGGGESRKTSVEQVEEESALRRAPEEQVAVTG